MKPCHWLLTSLVLGSSAWAQPGPRVQPTLSGRLIKLQGHELRVEDSQGKVWVGHLTHGFRVDWQGRFLPLSQLPLGQSMMFRLAGALNDSPRQVDLIADLASSGRYRAAGAPVPGYVRKGDLVGPGGVGGTPDNGPHLGKVPNVGAYAPHGGMPHQNLPAPRLAP